MSQSKANVEKASLLDGDKSTWLIQAYDLSANDAFADDGLAFWVMIWAKTMLNEVRAGESIL